MIFLLKNKNLSVDFRKVKWEIVSNGIKEIIFDKKSTKTFLYQENSKTYLKEHDILIWFNLLVILNVIPKSKIRTGQLRANDIFMSIHVHSFAFKIHLSRTKDVKKQDTLL